MAYRCKTLITTEKEVASNEKRLSICLWSNGFSFSEVSTSGHLLTFGEAEGEHPHSMTEVMSAVKSFFSSVGIRPLGYAGIGLVVLSDNSTWVPDELYSSAANRQYLRLVGCEATSILTSHSQELASTAVFTADDALVTAFKVALPGLTVINQHVRLASASLSQRSKMHPVLLAHWRGKRVDFAAYRDGRYIFGNTLQADNDNEALYHTVEILKTYSLEGAGTELLLCGEVDRSRFALMSPYFPTASLYNGEFASFLNPEFKKLHTYRHALIL